MLSTIAAWKDMNQSRLAAAVAELSAHWPSLTIDEAALAAQIAARPEQEGFDADFYFAQACSRCDAAAIDIFQREFTPRIRAAAGGIAPGHEDDCLAMVLDRVLPPPAGLHNRIAHYSGRSRLSGWLRVIAVREAIRLKRRRYSRERNERQLAMQLSSRLDPLLDAAYFRYRPVLEKALEDALAELALDERTMIRMRFVDGATVDAIGKIYGRDKSAVSRRIQRVRGILVDRIRTTMKARALMSSSDVDSVIAKLLGHPQ
jgi:RNA polymerase sigma-70 factor (ECF subfamily)